VIRIREIDHVVLRVREKNTMIDFYCDVLGCHLEKDQSSIGLTQLRAGSCLVDLVEVDSQLGSIGGRAPGAEGKNLDHVCFRVDPFDDKSIFNHLHNHGVAPGTIESRYGAEGTGPSIYIEDPEGNTVELKGPPSFFGAETIA
jgi:glyoxylase I family protein